MIYPALLEDANKRNKDSMAGQLSLFDIVDDEVKKDFEVKMPNVGEFDKETLLSFEKEVLGIYVSGHPLEDYEEFLSKNVTNKTSDFVLQEVTEKPLVMHDAKTVVGGMLTAVTVKTTRKNQMMAFLTLEDVYGTVEIMVFPRDYEKYRSQLLVDKKVFVVGKAAVEEDRPAKVILHLKNPALFIRISILPYLCFTNSYISISAFSFSKSTTQNCTSVFSPISFWIC